MCKTMHKRNMELHISRILNTTKNSILDILLYSQNLHGFALICQMQCFASNAARWQAAWITDLIQESNFYVLN